MSQNYAEKLVKSGFLATLIFAIGAVIGYGLRIFISHNLSVEEFGVFYTILAIVGSFHIFKEFGLLTYLPVKIPEFLNLGQYGKVKKILKKSVYIQLSASIIIALFVLFLSSVFLPNLNSSSFTVFQIILASFVVSIFIDIFRSGLQGTKRFLAYSSVEPLRLCIVFVASFVLFLTGFGIIGVALAYLIAAAILAIAIPLYFFTKTKYIFHAKTSKVSKEEFEKFTGVVWIASLLAIITSYADTILLAWLKTPKEAGFYQVALPTAQLLSFYLTPMSIVLLPFISEFWAKRDLQMLNNAASFSVKILLVAILPAVIVLQVLSKEIIIFIFGDKFAPAVPALQFLIVGMVFYSFVPLFTTFILGIGKPKDIIKIMACMGIVNLVFDFILIPHFGSVGAAMSLTTAYLAGSLLALYLVRKTVKFTIQYKNTAKTITGGLLTAGLVITVKSFVQFTAVLESVLLIVIAVAFYSIFILATKTIDKRDIEVIRNTKIIPKPLEVILYKILRLSN